MTVLTVLFSSPDHAPIHQYKPSNHRSKKPLEKPRRTNAINKGWVRKRNPPNMHAFGRFLSNLDWSVLSR
jgi:hypothetical protein